MNKKFLIFGLLFFSLLQIVSAQTSKVAADSTASKVSEIEKQISALEQRRNEALVRFTSDHPDIKDLNQRIAYLQKQRGELLKPTLSASEIELFTRIIGARAKLQSCVLTSSARVCQSDLANLYRQAVSSPKVMSLLIETEIADYASSSSSARSAPQASQAADEASVNLQILILAQNQRIIELLEQLVKKR